MTVPDFDPGPFARRRKAVLERLGSGIAVLASAPVVTRSGDVEFPFRQDNDFYYLTGLEEPEAVCVLAPGRSPGEFILFVRARDAAQELWTGPRTGLDGALERFGANAAFAIESLEETLFPLLADADQVHLPLARDDAPLRRILALIRRAHTERQRSRSGTGPAAILDVGAIVHEMRLHKEPDEVERMRRAITIAAAAHREAMRATRPGMWEFELEALLGYGFRRRGATGPAYPPIVAAGPNATVLHYTANTRQLQENDLVLIDAGAEYGCYCADLTRTFPVATQYRGAQRAAYEVVLAAQREAIEAVRPGATLDDVHSRAVRRLTEGLIALGALKGEVDELVAAKRYRPYYMHRTSHWLGMDVHDVGNYRPDGAPRRLSPGMVFTVEPALYFRPDDEEVPRELRGLGIRIEDDVLVTTTGHEVLSADLPKAIDAVEALRSG